MFNPKIIGSFSIVGFALSFIIGLIYNTIAGAFVNAIVYAIVFGVLGVGVSFIYQKFLSVGQSYSDSDSSDLATSQEQVKGSRVDITISDDSLPEDEESPKFVVNTKKTSVSDSAPIEEVETSSQVSSDTNAQAAEKEIEVQDLPEQKSDVQVQDVSPTQVVAEPVETVKENVSEPASEAETVVENVEQQVVNEQNNSGFVPIQLGVQPATENGSPKESASDIEDSIDSLPDIGELAIGDGDSKDVESSDNFVSDSDFASAGVQSTPATSLTSSSGGAADAALMAKAISTALAKDD